MKVVWITILEAVLASVFIFILTYFVLRLDLAFSIVLAALASATAPASTMMTIRQTGAKGDFVDTLLQVVALDDVVGLVLYSVAISIALASLSGASGFSFETLGKPVVLNPELVLTAAYFAQGKAGAQEKQNNEELRDLEEEMIVNLLRGKVFVPVQMLEGQTEMKPENMRFPLIKLSNGKMFQPVCSDNNELARFSVGQERIRGLVIEGKNIKNVLVKEADGVLLNPKTVKLAIPKMKL